MCVNFQGHTPIDFARKVGTEGYNDWLSRGLSAGGIQMLEVGADAVLAPSTTACARQFHHIFIFYPLVQLWTCVQALYEEAKKVHPPYMNNE